MTKNIDNESMLLILDGIEKKASKGNLPKLLDKNSSLEEHVKYSLCRLFVIYIKNNDMKIKDLSEIIKIPNTRISDITNYKVSGYTLDRLFTYAEKLANIDPQTREHLALTLDILDGPVRTVKETRRIKKEMKNVA